MLTAHSLALDGLSYIGEFSLDTFTQFAMARTAILSRLARCMTAAGQDIYLRRPDLFTLRIGLDVYGPETQTVTLTQGSKKVTIGPTAFTTVLGAGLAPVNGTYVYAVGSDGSVIGLNNGYRIVGVPGAWLMTAPFGSGSALYTSTGQLPWSAPWVMGPSTSPMPVNPPPVVTGGLFSRNIDGATCNVGGIWNEARQDATGGISLLNEWTGATGQVSMIVYGDSVLLNAALCSGVLGCVYRDNGVPLADLPNRDALMRYNLRRGGDYGRIGRYSTVTHRLASRPQAYWVETQQGTAGPVLRVRLAPLPDQYYALDFDVKQRAPTITVADIGTDATDPWTATGQTFGMPAGMDESIFEAYFLAHWLKAPWVDFKEEKAVRIDADRKAAENRLLDCRAQTQAGSAMHALGYGWR